MKKQPLLFAVLLAGTAAFSQHKQVTILQVPGKNQFAKIDPKGVSVLPSGRLITPAGDFIRITNDPFGLAISPDGKKAVTLHNGVFTIINIASLQNTRVPSYNQKINSPLAHEPISGNIIVADSAQHNIIKSPLANGSFLGVAFAADSKTVYLSGGDNGAVIIYDIENMQRLDSVSLNGKIDGVDFEDSFTSDLLLNDNE
jgi:DNA-binding beta-propeller fold protein YncE